MPKAGKARGDGGETPEKTPWRHADQAIDKTGVSRGGDHVGMHKAVLGSVLAGAPTFCGVCWHDITRS